MIKIIIFLVLGFSIAWGETEYSESKGKPFNFFIGPSSFLLGGYDVGAEWAISSSFVIGGELIKFNYDPDLFKVQAALRWLS